MHPRSIATPAVTPMPGGPDAAAADAYCARLTRDHYENFPVASMLVPRPLRPAVRAIYAFARAADDFADEPEHEGVRLPRLDAWERMLRRAFDGEAEHPIFVALGAAARRHALPLQPFLDLLAAFRLDVTKTRYEDFAALRDYCRLSAEPVGRLMLQVFEKRDPALQPLSDALCTGLQLANHWQDAGEDRARGRIYIPQESLRRHGVGEDALAKGDADAALRSLMRECVAHARAFFETARPLPRRAGGRLGWELRLTWLGGMRILERIEAAGYDVLSRPVRIGAADAARIALRSLTWRS